MQYYRLPIITRTIAPHLNTAHFLHSEWLTLGNFGVKLKYLNKKPAPTEVRDYARIEEKSDIYVLANSVYSALDLFFLDPGTKTGDYELNENFAALRINHSEPVIELFDCELMEFSANKSVLCGKKNKYQHCEQQICTIEGYSPPEKCPVWIFLSLLSKSVPRTQIDFCGKKFEYVESANIVKLPEFTKLLME